jgi:hypothetical protein
VARPEVDIAARVGDARPDVGLLRVEDGLERRRERERAVVGDRDADGVALLDVGALAELVEDGRAGARGGRGQERERGEEDRRCS